MSVTVLVRMLHFVMYVAGNMRWDEKCLFHFALQLWFETF
jgi:hypothetical protein